MLGSEIGESSASGKESTPSSFSLHEKDTDPPGSSGSDACPVQTMSNMYDEIVGTRCRAPYRPDWGAKVYGNALIATVENDLELEMPKVSLLILASWDFHDNFCQEIRLIKKIWNTESRF